MEHKSVTPSDKQTAILNIMVEIARVSNDIAKLTGGLATTMETLKSASTRLSELEKSINTPDLQLVEDKE
jgi:hypothetical protein